MMSELLFAMAVALLPVAAWSGWYFGRRDARGVDRTRQRDQRIIQECCKGINYLLDERPDKAIEAITEVLRTDDETIETHFALAGLFRRRGEADRAIRIHQHLVARPGLDAEHRFRAMYELGVDYLRAGLFDRAETLFKELYEAGQYQQSVLNHLADLYQREQDWDQAIATIQNLQRVGVGDFRVTHAQLLCERAEQLLRQGDLAEARGALLQALRIDPQGPRANLLLARIAMQQGQYRVAAQHLRDVADQDADFVAETIAPLVTCYRELAREDELFGYLNELTARKTGISPVLALAQLHVERGQLQTAVEVLVKALAAAPTVRGIDRLVDYLQRQSNAADSTALDLVRECTRRLLAGRDHYQCGKCGFVGKELHWQCPGCRSWSTVKPMHGIVED